MQGRVYRLSAVPEPESRSRRKIGVFPDFSRSTFRLRFEKKNFFPEDLKGFSTLSEKRAGVQYDGGSCTRVWPSFFPTKNPRDWPSGSLLWEKTACETEKRLLGEKASSASAFVFFQKNREFLPFGLSEKTESDTTYQNVQGYGTTVVAVRRWPNFQ